MFNARKAAAMAAGNHLTIDESPGLRLVATAKAKSWTYRYKNPIDGRMKQMKLGEWPAMSFGAATVAWEAARQQRAAGVSPSAQRRADRVRATAALSASMLYTTRDVCDEFLAGYKGTVVTTTYDEAEWLFRTRLGPIEHMVAAEVTRGDAFDLLHAMRDRPVLARRLRQWLGAAWDRALDAGRLPADIPNWWRLVLRGKLPSKGKRLRGKPIGVGKRVLDPAEYGTLLRWMPNFLENTRDVLLIYAYTLCRGAEIVAMERSEVTREPDGVWWTVPKDKLKMRRNPLTVDLRVPLIGDALKVVERRLAETKGRWLFPSTKKGAHIAQDAIGSAVYHRMPYSAARPLQTRPRLTVTNWAPHDLRRTGRTMLAGMGCPLEIGEAILGHLMPGVVGTYDRHHYNAERRLWLTRLAERLDALAAAA